MMDDSARSLDPLDRLVELGFSEYEAKAYVALLRESPVTGYQLSKLSSVPRSMIYEVLGKLTSRGAAMTLHKEGSVKYAPVPAEEFLEQVHREHEELISTLREDLVQLGSTSDLDYVWNIEGHENIMAKAEEMIAQAQQRIYLLLLPETFPALRPMLLAAIRRGVRVVVYSQRHLDLPGGQAVIVPPSKGAASRVEGLGLVLTIDEQEVLISEWLTGTQARASWTGSSLFVFIAEHHLRTDPYLPVVLECLGDQAAELIREEDRELFARSMESRLGG
jgi:sugar-specific transcriptional regulator TrmB